MTQRHGGRDTGLAGKNLPAVLRSQQAQVQEIALEPRLTLDFPARHLCEPERLRHFAGTGLVVPRGAADQEDAVGAFATALAPRCRLDRFPRVQPFDRQLILRIRKSRARPSLDWALAGVMVCLLGDVRDPPDLSLDDAKRRIMKPLAQSVDEFLL